MNSVLEKLWPAGLEGVALGWQATVDQFLASDEGVKLRQDLLDLEATGVTVYPARPLCALELTPPEQVRVVIVGEDPYPNIDDANGLAFAVSRHDVLPGSLANIFKELKRQYGRAPDSGTVLENWASQGVLLLNTYLTRDTEQMVKGWKTVHKRWGLLTAAILRQLIDCGRPMVFVTWGTPARDHMKRALQGQTLTKICRWLFSYHPSGMSVRRQPYPFLGCGHFEMTNEFLRDSGLDPIDWLGDARGQPVKSTGFHI